MQPKHVAKNTFRKYIQDHSIESPLIVEGHAICLQSLAWVFIHQGVYHTTFGIGVIYWWVRWPLQTVMPAHRGQWYAGCVGVVFHRHGSRIKYGGPGLLCGSTGCLLLTSRVWVGLEVGPWRWGQWLEEVGNVAEAVLSNAQSSSIRQRFLLTDGI